MRLDAAPPEGCQCGIRVVWGHGHEKTTGGLRIEKQVLVFGQDAWFEPCAFADEGAIVF